MLNTKMKILAIGDKRYYRSSNWELDWLDLKKDSATITINKNDYDAVCAIFDSYANSESILEWFEKSKRNINPNIPFILLSSNKKIDLHIRALDLGFAGILCTEESSFQELQNDIADIIHSWLSSSPQSKPIFFGATNVIAQQQIGFFLEEVTSANGKGQYIIQSGFGIGDSFLNMFLKPKLADMTIREVNCDINLNISDFEEKDIIIIQGVEYCIGSVQLQVLELVKKANKVIFFLNPDFAIALDKGFNTDLHKWMFANCSRIDLPSISSILSCSSESDNFE